jgi:hypothetical protein
VAHPNEEVVRTGYDAFSRGDMDTLRGLFVDDVVWHIPGRSPLAGDHRGVDAVLGYLARRWSSPAGRFRSSCMTSWQTTATPWACILLEVSATARPLKTTRC